MLFTTTIDVMIRGGVFSKAELKIAELLFEELILFHQFFHLLEGF